MNASRIAGRDKTDVLVLGAHNAMWFGEVPGEGPVLQDAEPLHVDVHERPHRYQPGAEADERAPADSRVVWRAHWCHCPGNDYTLYPFSTQNPTDYANLRDVYMDAVFHPH